MEIAGSHQMTPIVRHNDESGNTRIGMTQKAHLDDFLRGRIIDRLECMCWRTLSEVSEELGITQNAISKLWKRFQDEERERRYRGIKSEPLREDTAHGHLSPVHHRFGLPLQRDHLRQWNQGSARGGVQLLFFAMVISCRRDVR
ncbi:uncharacterized protein TNCV_4991611 [Trichonephila clavipes]|nr:uncharacterized protein TNCV_4991611 [Trichonephila clavipes]